MVSKEFKIIVSGAVTITLVAVLFNLVLKLDLILSLSVSIVLGVIIGLIINSLGKPLKPLSLILGIIAWGLIGFALFSALLKWLRIISSPPLTEILLGAGLLELMRIETKLKGELTGIKVRLSLLWNDFKKRKGI